MKAVNLSVAIMLLAISVISNAEPKIFVREYNYQASESDSKLSARSCALSAVKGLLVEELGVYIESYVNYNIEDDGLKISKDFYTNEIRQMSMGVAETKIIDEQWDGHTYYVKAEITVDPSDVVRRINKSIEDRKNDVSVDSLQAELEKSKEHIVELERKLNELNTSLRKEEDLEMQLRCADASANLLDYIVESNDITAVALKLPLGMRRYKVKDVMGEPDEFDSFSLERRVTWYECKYGNVWLLFRDYDLVYAVGVYDFCHKCDKSAYEGRGVKNLLKNKLTYDSDKQ